MGLEFNDNGVVRILTVEDMATDLFRDSYSDLFKSLHNFRPRSSYQWDPQYMLKFFDEYEADMARRAEEDREEDAARLLYLNEKHNRTFKDLEEADAFNREAAYQRYEREAEEARQAAKLKEKFNARFSPLPVVECWMYGDRI